MDPQQVIDFLENGLIDIPLGGIDETETWWVERQEALERAGYMLRPRYRPGWKPSWEGTDKFYFRCEDGQSEAVRVDLFSSFLPLFTKSSGVCVLTEPESPTRDL